MNIIDIMAYFLSALGVFGFMHFYRYSKATVCARKMWKASGIKNYDARATKIYYEFIRQAGLLLRENKAPNFVTTSFIDNEGKLLVVTVRYATGITPAERIQSLEAELCEIGGALYHCARSKFMDADITIASKEKILHHHGISAECLR